MTTARHAARIFGAITLAFVVSRNLSATVMPLGAATGYNVFTFSNFTESGTDSLGRMAVGGNFISTGFSIASNNGSDAAGTYDLVVGGNYSNSYNRVGGGDIFVGGNMDWTGPTIPNNAYVNGNVTNSGYGSVGGKIYYGGTYSSTGTLANQKMATPKASPIDFMSAKTDLTSLSSSLASQVQNGTVADNGYNTFTLTGTNSTTNIFNLSKSSYSSSTINISAPTGSTVIINVAGTAASFNSGSINVSGTDIRNVIFNFGSATTLSLSTIDFNGTILAPLAAISTNSGNVDGQVIANSISGNTEFHDYLFTGTLPSGARSNGVSATPEPGTWAMIGGGLALIFIAKRRKVLKPAKA